MKDQKFIQKLNIKLIDLEKQPNVNAEKKGQISENLRNSEKEKDNNQTKSVSSPQKQNEINQFPSP